jgi:hypothetical protein
MPPALHKRRIPCTAAALIACLMPLAPRRACAIDFYEIQIYRVETTPVHHLSLELHSNTTTTATGEWAHEAIDPYQVHETFEASYGLLDWLEIGQYLCTAKLSDGHYEYAGARTKIHFGVPQSEDWPLQIGGNIELEYMRFQAEEHPLSLEIRPIVQKKLSRFTLVANLTVEKPFSGQGNKGVGFSPSGELLYRLTDWIEPGMEYYSEIGPLSDIPSVQRQQQFVVPTLNFDFLPQLELNFGVGIGLTRTSNGLFLKSIVGWTF